MWMGRRGEIASPMMVTRPQSTNQVEKFSGMCEVMSGSLLDVATLTARGSNAAAPRRESMALNRLKCPPREPARQAIFLGATEPRAARPERSRPRFIK